MAEAIEMQFGLWAWMGPRNYTLDGGSRTPVGRGNCKGKRGDP